MKTVIFVVFLLISVDFKSALLAQSFEPSNNPSLNMSKSIFRIGEEVSPISSVQINLAGSPMGAVPNYFTGSITFGISGVLSGSFMHENAFGTPLGKIIPTNQLELRLQILEQRQYFPSVSLVYGGMIKKKSEAYSVVDLNKYEPYLVQIGLGYITSNAIKTSYGIGVTSNIKNKIILSGLFGVHQLTWQQGFTHYTDNTNPTQTINQLPLPIITSINLFLSAGVNYCLTDYIDIFASFKSLPMLEIEPTTFRIGIKNGFVNTLGVQYQLTNAIRFDLNDTYYSGYTHIQSYHHLRIGINTGFAF